MWTPEQVLAAVPDDIRPRFAPKVIFGEGCWIWTAAKDKDGYGLFTPRPSAGGKMGRVHRLVYQWVIGPIPKGLTLDHVKARGCVSRACFRPDHLEPVTNIVNILRGEGLAAQNARKTHCKRGHALTEANVLYSPPTSKLRRCRECMRLASRTDKRKAYASLYRKKNAGKLREYARLAQQRHRARKKACGTLSS